MRIDLHTHSDASDGTDTPEQLVQAARDAGLDVVAITDHDTTAGWDEAAAAVQAWERAPALVRGMEWSTSARAEEGDPDRPVSVHLLCYLFDPGSEAIVSELGRLHGERTRRLRVMAERMVADGIAIDVDALFADPDRVPGRPHLARALVDAGEVESIAAAFDGQLSPRGPYYEHKRDTPIGDAVRAVAEAGGVTVIAHPRARTRGRLMAVEHIEELAAAGLSGLEVDHIDHAEEDRDVLRRLARRLDLIVTGSSDFHGEHKTVGLGANLTAEDQYCALVERAHGAGVIPSVAATGRGAHRGSDEEA